MAKNKRLNFLFARTLFVLFCLFFVLLSFLIPSRASAERNTSDQDILEPEVSPILMPLSFSGTASDQSVTLSWQDPNEPNPSAKYKIVYGETPFLDFEENFLGLFNVESTGKLDVGMLTNNNKYYFELGRFNGEELVSFSKIITLTPLDGKAPITTSISAPQLPDGQNNWFKTLPTISLTADEESATYFQWDGYGSTGFLNYTGPITAKEGDHTLYFYSVDQVGNTEKVKWQTIKVDTVLPSVPVVTGTFDQKNLLLNLVWNEDPEIAHYEVLSLLPSPTLLADLPAKSTAYLTALAPGNSYQFKVVAFDLAGNAISSNFYQVEVPKAAEITPAISTTNQGTIINSAVQEKAASKIAPQIGEGASTVAENNSDKVTDNSLPKNIAGETAENQSAAKNNGWNRMLIALGVIVIAAGITIGGFYGYEFMTTKENVDVKGKDSRW